MIDFVTDYGVVDLPIRDIGVARVWYRKYFSGRVEQFGYIDGVRLADEEGIGVPRRFITVEYPVKLNRLHNFFMYQQIRADYNPARSEMHRIYDVSEESVTFVFAYGPAIIQALTFRIVGIAATEQKDN